MLIYKLAVSSTTGSKLYRYTTGMNEYTENNPLLPQVNCLLVTELLPEKIKIPKA